MGGSETFDAKALSWDDNPVRRKMTQDIFRAIRRAAALSPDMDILDFGCGTGNLALLLRPYVRSVTGMDSSRGDA